jgi:hypothetical protein
MPDRRAHECGEAVLGGVVEVVLVAEEDHPVFEERGADRRDDVRGEVAAEGDVVDAGPDVAAQFGDRRGGGHGRGPFPEV